MTREEACDVADCGVEELIKALEQGKSQKLLEYLAFQARFHQYSFRNSLLIAMQKPEATYVAGFQRWKELGRFVKKGEKGICILAPLVRRAKATAEGTTEREEEPATARLVGFRTTYVFDVSQTEGAEIAEFITVTGDPGKRLALLKEYVAACGVEFRYEDSLGDADGVSQGGKIALVKGLSAPEEFSVLVHELAHELLHRTERRQETTVRVRELEAEAVSYVVSRAAGLDGLSHSSDYIQLYAGDKELLLASLDHIQRTAAEIIAALMAESSAEAADAA